MSKPLTEDEILDLYMETLDNPLDALVEPEDLVRIFEEMAKIEGIQKMFRNMSGMDMKLFWLAKSDTERDRIRGHASALTYIRGMMKNIEEKKEALLMGRKRAK